MFRNDISFEREEHGRALAHPSEIVLAGGVPINEAGAPKPQGHRRIYGHIARAKPPRIAGIGAGVLVETDQGPVPAGEITVNQRVKTLRNGYQPVLWVGRERREYGRNTDNLPICLPDNYRSDCRADKPLLVAHDQNILVRHAMNEMFFGTSDVLAPAGFMTYIQDVSELKDAINMEWVHLLFDRVDVIQAQGVWLESMRPEYSALAASSDAMSQDLKSAIPALRYEHGFAAYDHSLPVLNAREAKILELSRL